MEALAALPEYAIYAIVGGALGAMFAAIGWALERQGLKQGRFAVLLAFVATPPLVQNYVLPAIEEPRLSAILNQGLPRQIDAYTTLNLVTLRDGRLAYHYTTQGIAQSDVDASALKQDGLPTLCETFRTDFAQHRYQSVEYRYDLQGSIESFTITPADY